jgi:hypothetical protein
MSIKHQQPLSCRCARLAIPICLHAAMRGWSFSFVFMPLCAAAPRNRSVRFPGPSLGRGFAPNPKCTSVARHSSWLMPRLRSTTHHAVLMAASPYNERRGVAGTSLMHQTLPRNGPATPAAMHQTLHVIVPATPAMRWIVEIEEPITILCYCEV